jgi:hypothetical protein
VVTDGVTPPLGDRPLDGFVRSRVPLGAGKPTSQPVGDRGDEIGSGVAGQQLAIEPVGEDDEWIHQVHRSLQRHRLFQGGEGRTVQCVHRRKCVEEVTADGEKGRGLLPQQGAELLLAESGRAVGHCHEREEEGGDAVGCHTGEGFEDRRRHAVCPGVGVEQRYEVFSQAVGLQRGQYAGRIAQRMLIDEPHGFLAASDKADRGHQSNCLGVPQRSGQAREVDGAGHGLGAGVHELAFMELSPVFVLPVEEIGGQFTGIGGRLVPTGHGEDRSECRHVYFQRGGARRPCGRRQCHGGRHVELARVGVTGVGEHPVPVAGVDGQRPQGQPGRFNGEVVTQKPAGPPPPVAGRPGDQDDPRRPVVVQWPVEQDAAQQRNRPPLRVVDDQQPALLADGHLSGQDLRVDAGPVQSSAEYRPPRSGGQVRELLGQSGLALSA